MYKALVNNEKIRKGDVDDGMYELSYMDTNYNHRVHVLSKDAMMFFAKALDHRMLRGYTVYRINKGATCV